MSSPRTPREIDRHFLGMALAGLIVIAVVAATGLLAAWISTAFAVGTAVVVGIGLCVVVGKSYGWPVAWAFVVGGTFFGVIALQTSAFRQVESAQQTGPVTLEEIDNSPDRESFYLSGVEFGAIEHEYTTCTEDDCTDSVMVSVRSAGATADSPIRHWISANQGNDFDESFVFSRTFTFSSDEEEVKRACQKSSIPCAEKMSYFEPLDPSRISRPPPPLIPLALLFVLWLMPVVLGWLHTRDEWETSQRPQRGPESAGAVTKRYFRHAMSGALIFAVLPSMGLLALIAPQWVAGMAICLIGTVLLVLAFQLSGWVVIWPMIWALGCGFATVDFATNHLMVEGAKERGPVSLESLATASRERAHLIKGLRTAPLRGHYEVCGEHTCSKYELLGLVSEGWRAGEKIPAWTYFDTRGLKDDWAFVVDQPTTNQLVGVKRACGTKGANCAPNWFFLRHMDPEKTDLVENGPFTMVGLLFLFVWLGPVLIGYLAALVRRGSRNAAADENQLDEPGAG